MATLVKYHEKESQELHPLFETDENKGENLRAPRTVTEIYTAPGDSDVSTCFFTTSTDLLVNVEEVMLYLLLLLLNVPWRGEGAAAAVPPNRKYFSKT